MQVYNLNEEQKSRVFDIATTLNSYQQSQLDTFSLGMMERLVNTSIVPIIVTMTSDRLTEAGADKLLETYKWLQTGKDPFKNEHFNKAIQSCAGQIYNILNVLDPSRYPVRAKGTLIPVTGSRRNMDTRLIQGTIIQISGMNLQIVSDDSERLYANKLDGQGNVIATNERFTGSSTINMIRTSGIEMYLATGVETIDRLERAWAMSISEPIGHTSSAWYNIGNNTLYLNPRTSVSPVGNAVVRYNSQNYSLIGKTINNGIGYLIYSQGGSRIAVSAHNLYRNSHAYNQQSVMEFFKDPKTRYFDYPTFDINRRDREDVIILPIEEQLPTTVDEINRLLAEEDGEDFFDDLDQSVEPVVDSPSGWVTVNGTQPTGRPSNNIEDVLRENPFFITGTRRTNR